MIRRRRYRRYRRRKGTVGFFGYPKLCYYVHKYRYCVSFGSSAGFVDIVSKDCGNAVKKVCKNGQMQVYASGLNDFRPMFPDYRPPTSTLPGVAPYFTSDSRLKVLLDRYAKYKLVSVKIYAKNFIFQKITIRCKSGEVTDEDRLAIQKYYGSLYGDDGPMDLSQFVLDYSKFDIETVDLPGVNVDIDWRNRTVKTDADIVEPELRYTVGDLPLRNKKLHRRSVLCQNYYPKATTYLDTKLFFEDKYKNFKIWIDAMGANNYPNLCYARLSLGLDQYYSGNKNEMYMYCMRYDCDTYYKFKFAGVNDLTDR